MTVSRTPTRTTPALAALLLALATPLLAHATEAGDTLPEARTLVDRHLAAVGGEDALKAASTGTMHGTFAMPAANLTAPMMVWAHGHERIASRVELPGMGEIRSGIHGQIAWELNPFQGPRILEGKERAKLIESTHPDAVRRLDSFVSHMETSGLAEYDGKACHKVQIQWRSGRESWDCYGVDDGLLLAQGGLESSPMGEIESVSVVKEYGVLNGLRMPVVTEVRAMGQVQQIRTTDFDPTAPDPAVFELPAPIKALAEQANP